MADKTQKIKAKADVIFARSPEYRVIAATGAWGGLSPNGELVFDFYVERRATPDRMEITVASNGSAEEKRLPDPQPLLREAQVGVVLRPDIAKSIGQFLIRYAEQATIPESEE